MRSLAAVLTRRLAALFVCLAALAAPAAAEIIILRSNLAGVARGDILPDGRLVTLDAAHELRIMAPNGSTRILGGPNAFRVGELPGADSAPVDAFNRAVAFLSGAGREEGGALAARAPSFDMALNGVTFAREDGFCYASDGMVTIFRPDASERSVLRATTRGFRPVEIVFEAGERTRTVRAAELFLRGGGEYTLSFEDGPSAMLRARAVPAEALAGEFAATVLLGEGCEQQFEAHLN